MSAGSPERESKRAKTGLWTQAGGTFVNDPSSPASDHSTETIAVAGAQAGTELAGVVRSYLGSRDYNGLPLERLPAGWDVDHLLDLVLDGLVQVMTDDDYPNMHIRPWPSQRPREDQAASLQAAIDGTAPCCLYPTPQAMKEHPLPALSDKPFTEAVARGAGVLEQVYFELAAFEPYRNDPRYRYDLDDFGFTFGIGDDAYLNVNEPDYDKIHSVRAGFAFDKAALNACGSSVKRYACALLADLRRITPKHQQRLKTWEVDGSGLTPHPTWWRMQMGEWPEHIGPFEKILGEIEALNEVWTICFGKPLFRSADRPRDWGWLIRASTNEWDAFILTTDKLLGDNLQSQALDAAGAPLTGADGKPLGTLGRLEALLRERSSVDPDVIRATLRPLREVRKQRQRPAHATAEALTDESVFDRQRTLLGDLGTSLEALRRFMSKHPKARQAEWQGDAHLDDWLTL